MLQKINFGVVSHRDQQAGSSHSLDVMKCIVAEDT